MKKVFSAEDRSYLDIFRSISSVLEERIIGSYEDNIAMTLTSAIPDYDPAWCEDDWVDSKTQRKLDEARTAYVLALADELMANYTRYR